MTLADASVGMLESLWYCLVLWPSSILMRAAVISLPSPSALWDADLRSTVSDETCSLPRVPALWPYCAWIQTYRVRQLAGSDETILWLSGLKQKRNGNAQVCRILSFLAVFLKPDRDVEIVSRCFNCEMNSTWKWRCNCSFLCWTTAKMISPLINKSQEFW